MSYIFEIIGDGEPLRFPASNNPIKKEEDAKLQDDVAYAIRVLEEEKEIKYETLYINDVEVDTQKKNIFEGYYGRIKISAEVETKLPSAKSKVERISTGYIHVMPKDEKVLEKIYKMIQYIVDRSKDIEFPNVVNDLFGISPDGENTNFKTEDLLDHIFKEYEKNFRHFYNNSRARLTSVSRVDSIEKLRNFSQDTARFIVTHPQYLAEVKKKGPIRVQIGDDERFFSPLKTLVSTNEKHFDIYENQMVLGFLKHIIEKYEGAGNVLSFKDLFFFAKKGEKLEMKNCNELREKFRLMYERYKNIFGDIEPVNVDFLPTMTHIFKNVRHYQNIYKYMRLFFVGGRISSDENEVRWFLDTSSRIYEYYVFLKLDEEIEKDGFKRIDIKPSQGVLPKCFCYKKGMESKVLYYEPKIHYDRIDGELNLKRTSSASLSYESAQKEHIPSYTPDFIIKHIDKNGKETYEIADAKFSDFDTVRNCYMPPSVFKYLASVEAINGAKILGLTLYYCKGDKEGSFEHPSFKDPYVKIVSLS